MLQDRIALPLILTVAFLAQGGPDGGVTVLIGVVEGIPVLGIHHVELRQLCFGLEFPVRLEHGSKLALAQVEAVKLATQRLARG